MGKKSLTEAQLETIVMRSKMELKPCPFCGNEAKLKINTEMGGTNYQVLCTQCPTTVGRYWYWNQEDVIETWNKRTM